MIIICCFTNLTVTVTEVNKKSVNLSKEDGHQLSKNIVHDVVAQKSAHDVVTLVTYCLPRL